MYDVCSDQLEAINLHKKILAIHIKSNENGKLFLVFQKNVIIHIMDFLPSWWSPLCIWLNLTYLGRWQMKNVKVIQHTIMNNVLSRCSVLVCEETLVSTFLSLSVMLSILLESSHWFSWFRSDMRLVEAL